MNVKKAMDKLTEWHNAGEKLKQHIPSNDEVLHSWLAQLEEFSQDLPFLLQLSSDALKVLFAVFFSIFEAFLSTVFEYTGFYHREGSPENGAYGHQVK